MSRARTKTRDAGIQIVRKALQAPIRQIAENAGVEGLIVVGKVSEARGQAFGYDAQNDEYGDLLEKGIIDPAKVVRTALQDAASIAGLMITTEAAVADAPKKDGGHGHAHGGGRRHGRHDVSRARLQPHLQRKPPGGNTVGGSAFAAAYPLNRRQKGDGQRQEGRMREQELRCRAAPRSRVARAMTSPSPSLRSAPLPVVHSPAPARPIVLPKLWCNASRPALIQSTPRQG